MVSCTRRFLVMLLLCGAGSAGADDAEHTLGTIEVLGSSNAAGAVDVLDAAAVADTNLHDVDQLQDQIANLRIGALGGRATQTLVSLRGFTNPYGAPEAAMALYVDGVPVNDFYFFDQRLFDIERIEVRKGPQTSLGAEAGVIDIVTRAPDANARAYADASVQSRGGYDLGVGASGALSGNVYGSVAASKDGTDGYIDNLAAHRSANGQDGAGLRGRVVWQPSERTEFSAMLLARRIDDGGGEIYLPVERASFNRVLAYLGGQPLGRFDEDVDHAGASRLNSTLAALSGSWKGDAFRVRATAALRHGNAHNSTDYDLTPLPWFYMDSTYRVREGNLGLRVESNSAADAPWTWLAGAGADHRDLDFLRIFHIGPGNPWQFPVGAYPRTNALLFDRTLAAFGESGWRFGAEQRWRLSAGLRAERADRGVDFRANAIDPAAARLDRAYTQALPKFVLDYQLAPRTNVYISTARGWKPGGYNTDAFSAAQTQFRPEVTTAFEAGVKGGVGEQMTYALAAFHNRIRDYQDLVITEADISSMVINAKRATTQGIEANLMWRPDEHWQIGATAGTVRAVYADDLINPATAFRIDGHRLQNVPRHNYNLHAQFASAGWFARGEIAGAGAFVANAYNAANDALHEQQIPGYAIVNAKLGYRAAHWSAWVYAANLTDRRYFVSAGFGFDSLNGYAGAVGNVAPPRTLGAQVRWER